MPFYVRKKKKSLPVWPVTCSVQEIPKPNYPLRRHEVFSTKFLRGEIYKTSVLLVICSARVSTQVCTLMQNCGVTAPAGLQRGGQPHRALPGGQHSDGADRRRAGHPGADPAAAGKMALFLPLTVLWVFERM